MSPLTLLTLALGLLLAALPDSILAASNANIKYSGNSKLPLDPCDPYAGPWDKRNSAAVSQNLSNNESGCEKCIQVWYYDKSVTVNVTYTCSGLPQDGLELTLAPFMELADPGVGEIWADWGFVPC